VEDLVNVSKNIKRLRSAKKLTQEQLAETLHVTRQTISSWENDRTQPDIGMLAALAEALDTDVEDLIYGKKKHVGMEAAPADNKRTLSLVLSIFGVLLTAAGLIIMFVYFWESMPGLTRTVLSLLPLVVGAGAGLFTVLTKKQSVPAREGAAVLWFAGVIASNALVNGLFHVDLGFENLLFADMLLLLPVMFLLDSVFAFTAESAMSVCIIWWKVTAEEKGALPWILLATAAFACCCVYMLKNGQIRPVKQYCAWIIVLCMGVNVTMLAGYIAEFEDMAALFAAYIYVFALYIADKTVLFSLHLRLPALCVLCAAVFGCSTVLMMDKYADWDVEAGTLAVVLIAAAVCIGAAVFRGHASYRNNPMKIAFTALFAAFFLWMCFAHSMPQLLALAFSAGVGVLVVISGIRIERLLVANLGMLMLTADLVLVLQGMDFLNFFWMGALLLACGVIFLLANKRMMKTFKKHRNETDAAAEDAAPLPEAKEADEDGDA
jgi:transcriptional regulator with XRE-family HTH domain